MTFLFFFNSCNSINKKQENSITIKAKKVNGKYQGKYVELDANGNVLKNGYMIDGLKRGVWKSYENNNLTSVQKYMNDSLQYELDKNDYIYKEVYLEAINSFVPVPKSWDTNIAFEEERLLLTSVKDCDNPSGYCPNIVFSYEVNGGEFSFKDFVLNDKKELLENIDNSKEISFNKNIGRYESYQLRYKTTIENVTITGIMIWFNLDNKIVVFSSATEKSEIDKFVLLFLELGNSITKNKIKG